ncbi:glycoside hydrolase family 16 protein [Piromyces sp. E2]|nr:glycoside hydrolase family 16 protein [Piromyces sp. E2]|eukprot:OUM65877.1 glycoside hydrolase family 16 protein [Piromyces sp. E2]
MKFSKILTCVTVIGSAVASQGFSSCGNNCYSPNLYTCDNGILCPVGMKSCSGACYSPKEYHCENGSLVYGAEPVNTPPPSNAVGGDCSNGQKSCNGSCYDPSIYTCDNNQLCPAGMKSCSGACYNPMEYHCENGTLVYGSSDNNPPVNNPPANNPPANNPPANNPPTNNTPPPPSTGNDIKNYDGFKLVFSDEFEGDSLDHSKWTPEVNCWGGGNAEKQCYVDHPETIFVKDGQLHLKAIYKGAYQLHGNDKCTLDNEGSCSWTQPFISGRVNSKLNNLAWKYGKVRVKALLPSGPFLWPAIWMLPQDDVYGTWAASGEIDIMEARGQDPDIISHAIHYGGQWPNNTYSDKVVSIANAQNEWHVYGIDWTENYLVFSIDDQPTYSVDLNRNFYSGVGENPYTGPRQPFDQKFHLLFNVAVGGGFFNSGKYGEFNPSVHSQQWTRPEMAIDWVRVYQKK